MEKINIKKRIFIVGCPRSGTTFLQRLLLNVEGSFSMPETFFFQFLLNNHYIHVRSLPPLVKLSYPNEINKKTVGRIVDFMEKRCDLNISQDFKDDLFKKIELKEYGILDVFDVILESFAKSGQDVLIEKTPQHVFHCSYIKKLFPDAVILNIVRDPRDTYLSFVKMLSLVEKRKRTASEFCFLWNKSIEAATKCKVDTIRYEDLVQNPLNEISKLLERSGLSVKSLDDNRYKEIIQPKEVWHKNLKGGILSNNFNKYKDNLSESEINIIEKNCHKYMKLFDYSFDSKRSLTVDYIKDNVIWNVTKILLTLKFKILSLREMFYAKR